MAKAAATGATNALAPGNESPNMFYERYGGYPAYVQEYNRLAQLTVQRFGEEARQLFPLIDLGKAINPSSAIGAMWRTYLETAATRLNSLAAYLQSNLDDTDERVQGIVDLVGANLRASIYTDPSNERDVQNVLETIIRARALSFLREKVHIKYSSKTFVPDFTFDSMSLAIEVKFCNRPEKEKVIIDEINADIPAYQTKFKRLIFVVYDLGYIRDVAQFKSDIEDNLNVYVSVIKK